MADDTELEKRAVEELLRETNRARVRAETMGPAGWIKCPLRGANKRFLLNTLRSSGLPRRSTGQPSTARLCHELPSRSRSRSRTPPRDRGERKPHHRGRSHNTDDRDRDNGRSRDREQGRWKDSHKTVLETKTSRQLATGEGHAPSRGHSHSRGHSPS